MVAAVAVAILALVAAAVRAPKDVVDGFSLPADGQLTVRALDGEGNPVPRAEASLTVKPPDGYTRSIPGLVRDGRVVFHERLDGIVDVWGATDAEGESLPWGPIHVAISPSILRETEVRLPPGRTISGRVVDAAGNGVPHARVRATPMRSERVVGEARMVAGDDGAFVFRNLGDGEHALWLVAEGDGRYAVPVVARAGDSGVVLSLVAGVSARVEVVDEDDRPVAGASVLVSRRIPLGPHAWKYTAYSSTATRPDGIARLDGLDPSAECHLEVHGPREGTRYGRRQLESWKPIDTRVRLERAFTVRGRVTDAKGHAVAATVWRRTDPSTLTGVEASSDGRFEMDDVPYPGARLAAAPDGMHPDDFRWVRVTPQRPEVVLVLGAKAPRLVLGGGRAGQRVRFVLDGEGPPAAPIDCEVGADGAVLLSDLEEGVPYLVWAQPFDAGSDGSLWTSGFRVPADEIRLELVAGKAIRVRLKGAENARDVKVEVKGPLDTVLRARHTRDWVFEVAGLPDGRWTVNADAVGPTTALHADGVVDAGSTAELTLRAR